MKKGEEAKKEKWRQNTTKRATRDQRTTDKKGQ